MMEGVFGENRCKGVFGVAAREISRFFLRGKNREISTGRSGAGRDRP